MAKAPKKTTLEKPKKVSSKKAEANAEINQALEPTKAPKKKSNPNNEVPIEMVNHIIATCKKINNPILIDSDDKKLIDNLDAEIIKDAIYSSDVDFEQKLLKIVADYYTSNIKFTIIIADKKINPTHGMTMALNKFTPIKLIK